MIEAMKQAREVIELGDDASLAQRYAVLTNIDQAIAEAEKQEPVAWINAVMEQAQVFASAWSLVGGLFDGGSAMDDAEVAKNELRQMLATPPKREWVGLEDEDVATVKNEFNRGALWAEQVLKEKNT